MAKSVAELQIALGLKGVKAVEELKSQLRALGSAADVSSQDLGKIAAAVKRYSVKGGESIGVIKGQVTALKGLQQQVAINSSAFQRLGKDIAKYESKLRSAEQAAETSQAAIRRRGSFVKAAPGRFLEREAFLRSKPSEEAFGEQGELRPEFVAQQSQLNVLAEARIRLENRVEAQIRAVTKAQVDNNPKMRTAAEIVATYGGELNELPRTANNVQMELRELKSDFQNLTVGGKDYIATLRRINQLQGQLDDPFGTAARKQQIRSRLGKQQPLGMLPFDVPVQKSIERNRRKRAQKYGGFAGGGLANQPVQASGLFQQIASISQAGPKAELDMMGKSYQQVANSIKTATLASNGSINSLQAQRASWASLRAGLDPASLSYRKVGKEIDAVDRRLEKLNRKRGFSAKGAAQSLGAVAAGGIFGGPEGAIGGAIGAIGGPAGAAAGAAIGAQAGILRESLGATADYAAGLQKLEIALQGVAGAGYTDALKAAGQVTKELNVPQEVAIKGITRLSAAVIGAGGSVADAEVVFKNVTSAIKATGGGADDVQSAITAMVQVFSKGKVSAEELSGQLGERLPGAVTKFAEANFDGDMIALQKALKDGTVGLNELMKFILELGDEYSDTAKKIADSSADAGARSQVAFNEIKIAVGEALQPVGAELQLAFAKFVTDILPLLKAGAIAAANAIKFLLDASAFLVKNFKELSIIAGAAGLVLVLQNLIGIASALGTAVGGLTVFVKGLNLAMLLNPAVALAAGFAAAAVAINRAATANARFNKSVMEGKTPRKEAEDKLRGLNEKIKELDERMEKESNNRMLAALNRQLKAAKIAADDLSLAMELATSYEVSGITYDRMTGLPISGHEEKPKLTKFAPLVPEGGSGTGSEKVKMTAFELELRDRIRQATLDENDLLVSQLNTILAIQQADLEKEDLLARENAARDAVFKHLETVKKINQEALETEQEKAKALNEIKLITGEITQEEFDQEEIRQRAIELTKLFPGELEKVRSALEEAASPLGKFKQGLKDVFESAMDVKTALAEAGVQAVSSFGDAIVDFAVTGKAAFADMTRSILQDLAKIFLKAALFKSISLIPGVGDFLGLKNGDVLGKNGIVPFASGGIVDRPTFFEYGKGGAGNFGVMGEAGPEAIMPLKRGPGGRLGVEVTNQGGAVEAMNRYSRKRSGSSSGGLEALESQMGEGSLATAPIDVRYNVERINSVDYVTADQFQSGLQSAAAQGAQRGEQNTLKRLQMSGSTRKRIGL